MSYVALYRKYRPTNFANVIGQEMIVSVLKNSIRDGHISHAYLFTGPRGTGKTSIAKIFAKAINCENFYDDICMNCDICKAIEINNSDIIEIDAASNNGVDEIRILRDNVKLMPSFCKYKVYIIDEVHMLSTGAFNALLKTLEEPPSHVVFILATTEPNKIPLTILSRCQRFDFSRVDETQIVNRLKFILEQENASLCEEVLKQIALCSDGCLRDAVNLLDQALSLNNEDLTAEEIDRLSGRISKESIVNLYSKIVNVEYKELLDLSAKMNNDGKNLTDVTNQMLSVLRDISINNEVNSYFDENYSLMLNQLSITSSEILKISNLLNDMVKEIKNSNNQQTLFDIYLMELANMFKDKKVNVDSASMIGSSNVHMADNVVNNNNVDNTKNNEINSETNFENQNIDSLYIIDNKNQDNFLEELKKVRINNVLAEASKEELNIINAKYDNINDYFSNKKYNSLVEILNNGKIVVASNKYLLFCFSEDSQVSIFDNIYNKIEQFLIEIYNKEYKVVATSNKNWEEIKKSYIYNKKNNISYTLMDENSVKLTVDDNNGDLGNSATDLFGKNVVNIK